MRVINFAGYSKAQLRNFFKDFRDLLISVLCTYIQLLIIRDLCAYVKKLVHLYPLCVVVEIILLYQIACFNSIRPLYIFPYSAAVSQITWTLRRIEFPSWFVAKWQHFSVKSCMVCVTSKLSGVGEQTAVTLREASMIICFIHMWIVTTITAQCTLKSDIWVTKWGQNNCDYVNTCYIHNTLLCSFWRELWVELVLNSRTD